MVNVYAYNIETLKYIKQILIELKRVILNNTIIVGTSVSHFSTVDESFGWKISKKTLDLNYILNQMNPTDIHIFHSTKVECTGNSLWDRSYDESLRKS